MPSLKTRDKICYHSPRFNPNCTGYLGMELIGMYVGTLLATIIIHKHTKTYKLLLVYWRLAIL